MAIWNVKQLFASVFKCPTYFPEFYNDFTFLSNIYVCIIQYVYAPPNTHTYSLHTLSLHTHTHTHTHAYTGIRRKMSPSYVVRNPKEFKTQDL